MEKQILSNNASSEIEQPHLLPADPMISMIERVAMDPSADLDKLERMLAMKERIDANAAQSAFNVALAAAQDEMPKVAARHYNSQTKSKYADLSDIYDACMPIAAKHGFSFNAIPVSGGRDGFMDMRWTLRRGAHIESDKSEVPLDDKGMKGTANKTGTHAYGSTTSYGRRYLFCAVFNISIGSDSDGNGAPQGGVISDKEINTIETMLQKIKLDTSVLLAAEKIGAINELSKSRFDAVMDNLRITAHQRGVDL